MPLPILHVNLIILVMMQMTTIHRKLGPRRLFFKKKCINLTFYPKILRFDLIRHLPNNEDLNLVQYIVKQKSIPIKQPLIVFFINSIKMNTTRIKS